LEEGVPGESCSGGIWNSVEKGISQRANCQVFAPAVFELGKAPQKTNFLFRRYSIHAEHHVGVDQLLFLYVWRIFLSVMLDRLPCTAKLLNSFSINPLKFLCACSPCLFPAEENGIPPQQKLLWGKSSSFCKSRAKAHPDGRHFEKIRLKNEF
jgi:hypothetical protein